MKFYYRLAFLTLLASYQVFCLSAEEKDYAREAERIAVTARTLEIGSSGAVQVSQVHDQARTKLLVLLIEQNDVIIRLLKDRKDSKTPDELVQLVKEQAEIKQLLTDIKNSQNNSLIQKLLEDLKNKKIKDFF